MRFGSLFSGIGGIDLGLERAGMTCLFQVERDSDCLKILQRRWPDIPRFTDVEGFCCNMFGCVSTEYVLGLCGGPPDILVGGFPCQDVSNAGKRKGIDGERSGLWRGFIRIAAELGVGAMLIENTSGLRSRGFHRVLRDLADNGFDAEWASVPASPFGLAHQRQRLFILAYTPSLGLEGRITSEEELQEPVKTLDHVAHPPAVSQPLGVRNADGFPGGMDELKSRITALGNAVVPQVAEWIGRRILEKRNDKS